MQEDKRAIRMNPKDNVAVVLVRVESGEPVQVMYDNKVEKRILAKDEIDIYHKIAIAPIRKEEAVLKYGEIIGKAEQAIEIGEHVHVDNLKGVTIANAN